MKDQFRKDMEAFQDSVEKEAHTLRSVVNVDIPDELPDEGDELLTLFDTTVSNAVSSKYETTKGNLKKLNDDVTKQRRVVSQESATLYSQKQSIELLNKQREDLLGATRGVAKIQGVIEEMNKAEEIPQNHGYTIQKNPQVLLDFLDQAAREVEDNGPDDIPFDSMKKTLRRIKRLSKKAGKEQCPCCRRDFNGAERNVFAETMKQLADPNTSPLMKVDSEDREKYLALKGKIGHWRETVVDSMTDLNNVHRIEKELQELEPIVKAFDTQVKQREAELVVREKELSQLQDEENKLRNITVTARHWAETAKRIAEQQDSISTKVDQLRAETADSLGENNLETVEEQLNKMREEKDDLVDKINKLNRQITTINQNITNASQKVSCCVQTSAVSLSVRFSVGFSLTFFLSGVEHGGASPKERGEICRATGSYGEDQAVERTIVGY